MSRLGDLRIREAGLAAELAEVQRQLAAEQGVKVVNRPRSRARRVIAPTDTDRVAARKAVQDLSRSGMLPVRPDQE